MTSPISKNLNLSDRAALALRVLAVLLAFFAGVFFSRADSTAIAQSQITPKKPVNISSSQLTFDKLQGLTLFKGKVKALHGTVVLTADEIRAFTENNAATAKGHVKVVDKTEGVTLTCGNLEYQNMMDTMTAHDHPVLNSIDNEGRPVTIMGRQMELNSEAKTFVVNQNVEIIQADSKAEAQKATFLADQNKLVLEDDPRVYTSSAQISARRITTTLGAEKSFFAEGLADIVFNPTGEALPVKSKAGDLPEGSATKTPSAAKTPSATTGYSPSGGSAVGASPAGSSVRPNIVPASAIAPAGH